MSTVTLEECSTPGIAPAAIAIILGPWMPMVLSGGDGFEQCATPTVIIEDCSTPAVALTENSTIQISYTQGGI